MENPGKVPRVPTSMINWVNINDCGRKLGVGWGQRRQSHNNMVVYVGPICSLSVMALLCVLAEEDSEVTRHAAGVCLFLVVRMVMPAVRAEAFPYLPFPLLFYRQMTPYLFF